MTDEIELEQESDMSRDDVADLLETFAGNLRGSDPIEIDVGGQVVAIDPPETVAFEVELEDEPEDDGVERSVEFELEWRRRDSEDDFPDPSAVDD